MPTWRFWVIGLVGMLLSLYVLRGMLLPFVAGMAIAYFLDPLADRLEAKGLSRTLATTVIVVAFFLFLVLCGLILFPILHDQVVAFAERVPAYSQVIQNWLSPIIDEVRSKISAKDVERIRSTIGEYAGTALSWGVGVMQGVLTGSLAVFNIISLIFITPIVAFYLLRDWDHIVAKIDSWLPRDHRDTIRSQAEEIDTTLAGFVRGQATVCMVLGALYGIGLTLVGLDLGLVIGITAGVISFVPYLGTITGFVIGVGVAFAQTQGWELPLTVAVVFMIGQAIEGNFLTPKLVGDKVGLHPVWVMFALLAGAALFGILGMLLAVPVAAVIGVLVRFSIGRYLESPYYHGKSPP